jgi:pyridoxal phosphate enzyme (YggS family)
MSVIDDNLKQLSERINAACFRYSRNPNEITLVGVSKTRGVDEIRQAFHAGLDHFGENKVQEAEAKIRQIGDGPVWHMIGHLQTNKARKAAQLFDIIESVDSLKLARALATECANTNTRLKILLEVNASGETSKYGLKPDEVLTVAEKINDLDNLTLAGLMTIGPFTEESGAIEKSFSLAYELYGQMRDKFGSEINTLSMGMTGDFEQAIKYGSTELRIGTAIFGARDYSIAEN